MSDHEGQMTATLPSPGQIADHYNTLIETLGGDYIHSRWGDSEIKRRHYRQTQAALRFALEGNLRLGDVLEIGCGPAVWTPLFLDAASSVHLLDISEGMLEQAKARIAAVEGGRHAERVRYTCGDFCAAEMSPEGYDTVMSIRAFEYISDKPLFLRRCYELLRGSGRLLLVTKNRGWKDMRPRPGSLRRKLSVAHAMQTDLAAWSTTGDQLASWG
jgi:ubiquinone/menaquinone biosynthesis C-methylase UbiE